jgi:hypothetical protein
VAAPSATDIAADAAAKADADLASIYTGKWSGRAIVGERGNCQLSLEIRPKPSGEYAGYSGLVCMSLDVASKHKVDPLFLANLMKQKLTPDTADGLTGMDGLGAVGEDDSVLLSLHGHGREVNCSFRSKDDYRSNVLVRRLLSGYMGGSHGNLCLATHYL